MGLGPQHGTLSGRMGRLKTVLSADAGVAKVVKYFLIMLGCQILILGKEHVEKSELNWQGYFDRRHEIIHWYFHANEHPY